MLCDLGDSILGIDGCIYWPPFDAGHTQPSFESIKEALWATTLEFKILAMMCFAQTYF